MQLDLTALPPFETTSQGGGGPHADRTNLVIYHAECTDGFTAAWIANRALAYPTLYAASHGEDFPFGYLEETNVPPNVWILDFSYPREVLERVSEIVPWLLVLDHHATAEEALRDLPYAQFDMDRSGAGMTWDYLHPHHARPWLVNYVEDRDLWRKALPATDAVNAYVQSVLRTQLDYDSLAETPFFEVVRDGAHIKRYIDRLTDAAVQSARIVDLSHLDEKLSGVPIINAHNHAVSEALNYLLSGALMAIAWYQRSDGKYQYSVRTSDEVHAGEFAQQYGGGGHANSAGFVSDAMLF